MEWGGNGSKGMCLETSSSRKRDKIYGDHSGNGEKGGWGELQKRCTYFGNSLTGSRQKKVAVGMMIEWRIKVLVWFHIVVGEGKLRGIQFEYWSVRWGITVGVRIMMRRF